MSRTRTPSTQVVRAVGAAVVVCAIGTAWSGSLAQTSGADDVSAAAQTPSLPNPTVPDSCGTDVTLVLDASGSVASAGAVENVRDAGEAFLDALADTNSTARVIDFGSVARETAARAQVTTESVSRDGVHAEALDDYYDPKPPLQPGVEGHRYDGGDIASPNSYDDSDDTQYTNWDQSLGLSADEADTELIVFVTDGEPTALDFDRVGDPFFRAGATFPDVGIMSGHGSDRGEEEILNRAIEEANAAKANGSRVFAIGVGDAFGSSAAVNRLTAVSGPQVVTDPDDISDLNSVDVAVVEDFDRLTEALRNVVTQLCSPSLTIRKLAQTAGNAEFEPTPGWDVTVTPTVDTGTAPPYEWVLPVAGTPVGPQTVATDGNGFASFQWNPDPPTSESTATVTEEDDVDHVPLDFLCRSKQPDGSVIETSGALDPQDPTFVVDVGSLSIVTCTLRNAFDYQPAISIVKSNDPVLVHGDGAGEVVTSTYLVTNTGNTTLTVTDPVDDRCTSMTLVTPAGDGDTVLAPLEQWTYTCDRRIQHPLTDAEVEITNNVTVTGTAPNGEQVDDDTSATVEVITPDIVIEKTVNDTGTDTDTIASGDTVTYHYEVFTNGNTPLSGVATDDQCGPLVGPAAGDDVGADGLLEFGETWTYTCDVALTETTVNTATVAGTPELGPDVTDDDDAIVTVVNPDLTLTKDVTQRLVLSGSTVTYTFTLTNTGEEDLDTVVLTDNQAGCTPVLDETTDAGADGVLSIDETWIYLCEDVTIDARVINVATVTAEGVTTGTPLTASDAEIVIPLIPAIDVEKYASVSRVHSDDGDPTPADTVTYTFEVTNPSFVPLAGVTLADVSTESTEATDTACDSPTFLSGDDGDDLLERGEVWLYECTTTLTKAAVTDVPEAISNTVTASGTPTLGAQIGTPVTDTDTVEVEVIDPGIELVKTASASEVRIGEAVTYTYTVTNTGDSDLVYAAGGDDTCDPVTFVSGDTGSDGIASPNEVWTYTCTTEITELTVNTATVTGVDELGGLLPDTDVATVGVYDATIELVKTVDDHLVPQGDTVTYTFVVTNPGEDPLTDVTLTDTDCNPLTFVGGDDGDEILQPDESWTYSCDGPVDVPFLNTADVSGLDHLGGEVLADDVAFAVPYRAGIAIEKTASPTTIVGSGPVTYTYAVTNTGNVPLAGVAGSITDDRCGRPTYVSGDLNGNGLLDGFSEVFETPPAETWIFTCTMTISETTVNTVVVEGTPTLPRPTGPLTLGPAVDAGDVAEVTVTAAQLPRTGADDRRYALLGLTLGLTGLGLLVVGQARRRRRA